MEDVTSAILQQLTASCSECGITSDIIDREQQSFVCFPDSPTSVTYRARLEGTSERDSGSLISLIEEWLSGRVTIIVTGVLMTVDSKCSVAISSLSEAECQPPTTDPTTDSTTTTDNTAAIIGGSVVAVILIVALTIAAVTITFILKNRGNIKKNKRSEFCS